MTLLVIGISLALIAWVLKPLFEPVSDVPERRDEIERLVEMKHAIYRSIIDLEHDAKLGKVSEEDQASIRKQHEAEAITIIKQLDATAQTQSVTEIIEQEIAAARARMKGH